MVDLIMWVLLKMVFQVVVLLLGPKVSKMLKVKKNLVVKVGEWFDPCYHQLCDNLDNPDYEAWVINTKLIAHSVFMPNHSKDSQKENQRRKLPVHPIQKNQMNSSTEAPS